MSAVGISRGVSDVARVITGVALVGSQVGRISPRVSCLSTRRCTGYAQALSAVAVATTMVQTGEMNDIYS